MITQLKWLHHISLNLKYHYPPIALIHQDEVEEDDLPLRIIVQQEISHQVIMMMYVERLQQ